MALSIKDPETERLVRDLAARGNTGVTGAIKLAVGVELARRIKAAEESRNVRWDRIEAIQQSSRKLTVLDPRSDDEILGYDAMGLST